MKSDRNVAGIATIKIRVAAFARLDRILERIKGFLARGIISGALGCTRPFALPFGHVCRPACSSSFAQGQKPSYTARYSG